MTRKAAFYQDLNCLLHVRSKQSSGTEIHHNLEMSTCDQLECTLDNFIRMVSKYDKNQSEGNGLMHLQCKTISIKSDYV